MKPVVICSEINKCINESYGMKYNKQMYQWMELNEIKYYKQMYQWMEWNEI